MTSRIWHLPFTIAVLLVAISPLSAQEFSRSQNEVWQMEEAYWKDVKDAKLTHYMTLWHEQFLGWPRDRDKPVGKAGLEDGAKRKMADGHIVNYEILSKAVSVVGDTGVTQYSVRVVRVTKAGNEETYISRVTHTWLKTGSSWQIIGGMSAPIESSSHTW